MRIDLIIPSLGTGGAERVGVLLANGFCGRGHDVVVYTNLSFSRDYNMLPGITVIDISSSNKGKICKGLHMLKTIRNDVKLNHPDVFIGIMGVFSFIAYIACIGLNVPVIATMHNSFERPSNAKMSRKESFLKFVINKLFFRVTLLTNSDKIFIGDRLRNTLVMPNPLALKPIEIVNKRGKKILAAGRLDSWHYKGFDVLIKAFAKLVHGYDHFRHDFCYDSAKQASLMEFTAPKIQSEGWKLQIAGTGSEKSLDYLKGLCRENGVEDFVEFLGFQKDIEKLYQKASVFVLSSRYEAFGLVLIEAMSQGCACVACDYKGRQREILCHEGQVQSSELRDTKYEKQSQSSKIEVYDSGICCEPDNVEVLADAMKKMMMDDEYRESVRMNAVECSKFYSLDNTIERWEELLNQIINK